MVNTTSIASSQEKCAHVSDSIDDDDGNDVADVADAADSEDADVTFVIILKKS